MDPALDTTFGLLNLATVPWWLSMLLFPRTRATVRLVTSPWPFVALAGVYLTLLVISLASSGSFTGLDASSLAVFMAGPWGFLTAWAHMLTLNLFVGTWIFRDARYYGQLPRLELLLSWWMGPAGLGLYLWRRRAWTGPGGTPRTLN